MALRKKETALNETEMAPVKAETALIDTYILFDMIHAAPTRGNIALRSRRVAFSMNQNAAGREYAAPNKDINVVNGIQTAPNGDHEGPDTKKRVISEKSKREEARKRSSAEQKARNETEVEKNMQLDYNYYRRN